MASLCVVANGKPEKVAAMGRKRKWHRASALEPIYEVRIHEQWLGLVKRLSMRRIIARRTKAATVAA